MIDYTMSDASYHARSELSSTGARRILDSPARFRYWADHPEKPKAAFDVGSAAHAKILGVGAGVILYPDEHLTPSGNVSTKAATVEWEQEQRAHGLIPIGRSDAHRIDAMAEAVLADPSARRILETITGREVTIITEVDGVPIRVRFDLYGNGSGADLKTGRDASPKGFTRSVGTFGYHLQARWYEDGHEAETGRPLDEPFKFIVVESAAPHLVGVYDLDWAWRDVAAEKTKRARDIYRRCIETGEWPGYGTATLIAPAYIVMEGEDEEIKI